MSLEKAWETFVELYTKGDVEEAQTFYQEHLWPLLVAKWQHEPQGDLPQESFPISVHTLGTSPEAAVLAALALGSQEVHLLHTPDTEKHLPFVARWTGAKVIGHPVDREDPKPIYAVAQRLAQENRGPLAFDITGGTKVMSAALMAVGFMLAREGHPIEVYYVSNERYEPKVRRPVAGTERLKRVPPP